MFAPTFDNGDAKRPDYYSYVDGAGYGRAIDGDPRSVAQYWRLLRQHKGTLLLAAFLGALAAFVLTRMQSPVYRARMLLEIESLNEDFLNMRSVSPTASAGSFPSPESNIRTQAMVLQSRPVLERAIDKLDLEKRLVASKQGGRTVPWRGSQGSREQATPQDQALSVVAAGLKTRLEPNTRVIEVTFDSTDPRLASDVVNSIAAGFTELSLEKRWEASQHTSKWLTRELDDVRSKLENAESALRTYARESDLTFISEKDNAADDRLRQLQLELSKAQADRVAKQSEYELAATAPTESLPQVLDDATLKAYQVDLTNLRRQLAELSSSFTSEHPKVAKVQSQIATVEAALDKKRSNIISRIRNEYGAALRREKLLGADYAAQVGLMSRQADKVTRYLILKREVDSTRQLYDSLFQKAKEAGLASAMRASDIRVVESADPPASPYKPRPYLNAAFGLFSGICAGVAFIIVRARSDRSIQGPGDTSFHLNVPELGVIPASAVELDRGRRLLVRFGLHGLSTARPSRLELTTWDHWPSAMAESFRFILASILLSERNGEALRLIALASANPGEGKTTVISNLGIALAQIGRRVLLIDGDMRMPRLHDIFEVENSIGLSEVLAGAAAVIQETRIPKLFLLPSGRSADEGLLFAPRLRQFLRSQAEFDMILIDTPPLLQMSDARLISRHADAVILVVAQHTARDAILLAQQRLAEDGSRLLGTILNNWNPRTSVYGNREYYDYYKKYHQNGRAL